MDYTNEQIKAAAEACCYSDQCKCPNGNICPLINTEWVSDCTELFARRLLALESENADLRAKLAAKETILNGTYIDIGTYNHDTATLRAKLAESEKREKAAVEDITFIHCAGKYGCEICLNNDLCKKQNIQIGKCPDFDWRGVQAEKE